MDIAPSRPKVQAGYSPFGKDIGIGDTLTVGVKRVPARHLAVDLVEYLDDGFVLADEEGIVAGRLESDVGRGLEVERCNQFLHVLQGCTG